MRLFFTPLFVFERKQIAMIADEKSPTRISHRIFATSRSEMGINMNKNKYRLTGVIVIFCAVYSVLIFWNKTNMKTVLTEVCKELLLQTGVPSYAYIKNVDNDDFTFFENVINDICPINEYLMANENTGAVYTAADGIVQGNPAQDSENTSGKSSENAADVQISAEQTDRTVPSQENTSNAAQPDNSAQNADTQAQQGENADARQVISRNTVTGTVFSKAQLCDFSFVSKFYTVTSITSLTENILRPEEFLNKDLSITKDVTKPQILIFHTHSQETFADSVAGDPTTTIVGVGDYLTELLTQKYGYQVIHDTSVYDYVDGKLDRSKAYTYAEEGIAKILQENPSIEVVIDLHRDGVAETTHLLTEVDGKKMAKIMFFNGLSYSRVNGDIGYLYNPYRDDNLAMSLQMQLIGKAYYPDFLRNIYVNAYRYCLHERGRSMLIEAGAQTNTVEEVKNAMEPLADILNKFLSGEKVYE